MFSHTLVSVHLLDRRGNHFSSNPLINLPKGGKNKKTAPAAAKPISCVSHAKTSVQPFSRSESRCSGSTLNPDASFLPPPVERLAANEDHFYKCVRSTLSQQGSHAALSFSIRPLSVTSSLTPSGDLCCFKRDKRLYMA